MWQRTRPQRFLPQVVAHGMGFFGLFPAGLRGKPGHQTLADEPSIWAWFQTGAPGFLRAGSLHLYLVFS